MVPLAGYHPALCGQPISLSRLLRSTPTAIVPGPFPSILGRVRPFTPFFRCFSLLLLSGSAVLALAASFDCAKAATDQEKAICADARLSKLDEDVAAAYRKQHGQLSPTATAEVRQDQRDWLLRLRETCPGRFAPPRLRDCLSEAYSGRLYMLQSGLQRIGGLTFFPRLLVLTAPDRDKLEPNPSDPGFGVGRFSWPEIDNPTPPQAAWNAAVRKQAARMTPDTDDPRQPLADFDPSTVADTEIDVFCRLKSVSEWVISLELQSGTFAHGAPHPVASTISFVWWLDRKRASVRSKPMMSFVPEAVGKPSWPAAVTRN